MAFRPSAALRSSSQWLGRHFRDPYVRQRATHPAGFRSRSAFKLLELDERYALVRDQRVRTVVDLGAAPGGWSQAVANLWGVRDDVAQVLADRAAGRVRKQTREEFADVQEDPWDLPKDLKEPEPPPPPPPPPPADPDAPKRTLVALDLLHVQPIAGAHTIQADFLSPRATHLLDAVLQKHAGSTRVDVLLSDMAANATGNRTKDSEAALDLARAVIQFADGRLETAHAGSPGGTLVMKYFADPSMNKLHREVLMHSFKRVFISKPPSSRKESAENYFVCRGFSGFSATAKAALDAI